MPSCYVSQFTGEDIVLLKVDDYSSNHGVLYIIGISMTRRFQNATEKLKMHTPPLLRVE